MRSVSSLWNSAREGRDRGGRWTGRGSDVSIHAPVKGATGPLQPNVLNNVFLFITLTRGCGTNFSESQNPKPPPAFLPSCPLTSPRCHESQRLADQKISGSNISGKGARFNFGQFIKHYRMSPDTDTPHLLVVF